MMPLQLFKCLSDNTRLQSVLLISHFEEACVCDLIAALELDQPKVSRHLAELRRCGILQDERRGKWVYYRLHQDLPGWARDVIRLAADNNLSYFSCAIDKLHQYRQQGPGCQ
tara:strand:- start:802 stop:1137 length:336 start_codon:yes stop_codon:yes gene_type:complete